MQMLTVTKLFDNDEICYVLLYCCNLLSQNIICQH